jgi:hypothetical protein
MKLLPVLFWSLVLITGGISYRCGSMVGLIFFLFTFLIGAVVAAHFGLQLAGGW